MNLDRAILTVLPAVLLTAWIPFSLRADDQKVEDPKPAVAKDEKKPTEAGKDGKPVEPTLLDKLTKELLKDVDDGAAKPAAEQKENRLDSAARGMRNAGEKLDQDQTGQDTRKIQEQVIRDLDELIKQLQNPPPDNKGGGGGGGSSSSSSGGSGQSQMQKGGNSKQRQQQAKAQPSDGAAGGQSKKQEKKSAEGSEERTEGERKAAEEAARKKKLEMDVWGHLPPHLREQLLNTYGERMLPKYQHLVKQFYESLSEQNESVPRR
jgi:hypothetical protein